jgi:uncharacterized protein (DUF1330 family)
MQAYAIAQLSPVTTNDDLVTYLKRIDATLAPFDGRFIIHGGPQDVKEGVSNGDVIIVAFPSMLAAQEWYASPAYQVLIPLRTANAEGSVILIEGVGLDHRATDILPPELLT